MDRKEPRDPNWNREQWSPDNPGANVSEADEVWNKDQMEFDNTGTEREGTGRESTGDVLTGTGPESADMESISGRGKPSGESHWERVEPDK